MTFDDALTAELSAVPELVDKIYPVDAADGPKAPYAVYRSREGKPIKSLDGAILGRSVVVELNLLCPSYTSMKHVLGEVLSILESFEQREIGSDGPYIQELNYEEPIELYDPATKLHQCVINFQAYF
jgi:hypothetical protein